MNPLGVGGFSVTASDVFTFHFVRLLFVVKFFALSFAHLRMSYRTVLIGTLGSLGSKAQTFI